MSNKKDKDGNLLPDEDRLNKYGKILRSTSLDELPELLNILKGDMSIVGPRPLLVKYLPRYTEEQRKRHNIRPGLTGLAQINGRNAISWEEKFALDIAYVDNVSFWGDVKIIFGTIGAVFKRSGISSETSSTMEEFMGIEAEMITNE
jgi:lipopolysaccharide/colanic/teichoic acid biosynthesis glycosyltransferase